jgi:hypothetical protein
MLQHVQQGSKTEAHSLIREIPVLYDAVFTLYLVRSYTVNTASWMDEDFPYPKAITHNLFAEVRVSAVFTFIVRFFHPSVL